MTTKIEIDLSNVITSRDQIVPGQELWTVGQGGVTGVTEPSFFGYAIGFGASDYTFDEGAQSATGFVLRESEHGQFVAAVSELNVGEGPRDGAFVLPEKFLEVGKEYSLSDFKNEADKAYVIYTSAFPVPENNWYVCGSFEKAQAVYEEMSSKWGAEHENERVEYQRRSNAWDMILFDDHYEDYYEDAF